MSETFIWRISPVTGSMVRTVLVVEVEVGVGFRVRLPFTVRSVMVAVLEVRVLLMMLAREAVPVAVMLVPVAFPKSRLVMEARAADRKLVRKLPELTMFSEVVVPVKVKLFKVSIEVVDNTPFTVDSRVLEASPV